MHYLLFYEKAPDHAERQKPLQVLHRAHLEKPVAEAGLIFGGSLEDPTDGSALLLFQADSAAPIEAFAENDPYVKHGIVAKWWVRKWDVVVGRGAGM